MENIKLESLLALKLNILRNNGLPDLEYEDLKEAVVHGIWEDKIPDHVSDLADKVLSISSQDVLDSLTKLALTEGALKDPGEFTDLFRRNEDEE